MTAPHFRRFGLTFALLLGLGWVAAGAGCRSAGGGETAGRPQGERAAGAATGPLTLYVGTYTNAKTQSKGIYRLTFDPKTGDLGAPVLAAEARNPSFLTISPDHRYVYAVGEVEEVDGQKGGAVTSFSIGDDGSLTRLSQVSSGGAAPCYVSVDPTGRNVFAANYTGGSISRSVSGDDGKLVGPMMVVEFDGKTGPNKPRQDKSHAHMILPDPQNQFVLASDLGTDLLMIYRFDPLKGLVPTDSPTVSLKPGSGPRHFAFHPDGSRLFVINELANTITSFTYNGTEGTLKEVETVPTLPPDYTGQNLCAQILVHPSGKYVYGSNRGHDSIVAFAVDPQTGKLTLIGHTPSGGKQPRNFNFDPSGKFLVVANQGSNVVRVFKVDPATGQLSDAGKSAEVPAPVCVQFLVK